MIAPKILARRLDVKVNGLNEVFVSPDWHVALCCGARVRNITKQKTFGSQITDKSLHGTIAEHSRR
jgi:hypothetical protein